MLGMVGAAALASGGLLAPVACAVVMQACFGASIGGLVSAGLAKVWKSSEQSKEAKLQLVARDLERGGNVDGVINYHLGDKLVAKLGGWRLAKEPAPTSSIAPKSPSA